MFFYFGGKGKFYLIKSLRLLWRSNLLQLSIFESSGFPRVFDKHACLMVGRLCPGGILPRR